jgi:DNA-binding PadR family transcriptional regulator
MAEVMKHEFLLGFIKIYILRFAQREPVYGKEIHEHLAAEGNHLSYATLYKTFHSLEKKGYLVHEDCNVGGKIRKYYNITEIGSEALNIAVRQAEMLFADLASEKIKKTTSSINLPVNNPVTAG